jgi:RNA polymerase sigma-70 factor (ECF subfamily)
MTAQLCGKVRGSLRASGPEGDVMVPSSVSIFGSEHLDRATSRDRIIELYNNLRPSLYAYLGTLGVSSDQAEDVIQEAFLRLVRLRFRFEPSTQANLRAWLFRVAHNLSMDVHRFQRRWSHNNHEQCHTVIRHRADPAPTPEQQVILDERKRRVESAFAQLTPKQRQCVLLRAEGFRYREIATTLGVSVQRVGELMQRSIVLLAATYDPVLLEPDRNSGLER